MPPPNDTMSGNADLNVKTIARILQTKTNIKQFQGSNKGSISVKEFVDSLETYFLTEGIVEDSLRIGEVIKFVDAKVGDAYEVIGSAIFRSITSWDIYKKKLLNLFQTESEYDALCALEQLNDIKMGNDTFQMFIAKISNQISIVKLAAKDNYKLEIKDQTLKLMALSVINKQIPSHLKQKFKSNLNLDLDLWDQVEKVYRVIQTNKEKNNNNSNVNHIEQLDINNDQASQVDEHEQCEFVEIVGAQKLNYSNIVCYNCRFSGHYAKDCRNASFCQHCNKVGHTNNACYFKQKTYNQNFHSRNNQRKTT
jgi:hypothetical protein